MRLIDLRSGGGVLLLAAALSLGMVGWRLLPLGGDRGQAIGDGKHADSYGFDLTTTLVPVGDIVASGLARDVLHALEDPPTMSVAGVAAFNAEHRGKYLVSDDRVIGVEIDGQARAYPLRLMNWHEVVNDTLGGTPIAVTYHPLCDSVVVFDRRVGERTPRFGVSGLLLDSNLLMFDRQAAGGESLWSQLRARAVSGPAAAEGLTLDVVPASLARWTDWVERHPDTTVPRPDDAHYKAYRRNPYGSYLLAGKPRFPVDPLPPPGGLPWMTRLLVVEDATRQRALPLSAPHLETLARDAADLGARIRVAGGEASPSLLVEAAPGTRTYFSLWFAWYASYPDAATAALTAPVPRP